MRINWGKAVVSFMRLVGLRGVMLFALALLAAWRSRRSVRAESKTPTSTTL